MRVSESNVIASYLVKLGMQVDKKSAKDAQDFGKSTDISLKKVATSALAAVSAVALMSKQFASKFSEMHYSAQRIGTTVTSLEKLDYAAQRIGLSGGSMTEALEGMAKAMRMNPAISAAIEGMGIGVKGRDLGDVSRDLVKNLDKLPHFTGARMMEEWFGMPESTFLAIKTNQKEFDAAIEARKKSLSYVNADSDEMGRQGVQMQKNWQDVTTAIKDAANAVVMAFGPAINAALKLTEQWTHQGSYHIFAESY
jgi:hypothetical protein